MAAPFKGVVNIDIKDSTPDWGPYTQPMAPEGAPNVLYIVLDDVGFSAMEPFGGLIETPNMKRIADMGLTYTNFHTTALCSPTRSCLMTGRNHTTNGMALHHRGDLRLPERERPHPLRVREHRRGARRARLEHVHASASGTCCAEDEMNLASSKRSGPLGRGFERYYGFLGGETNQWYPDLVYDNHPVAAAEVRRRRATTSPSTSPTRRSSSSATRRRSRPTSRSSCTSAPAPRTPRTTRRRSGRTSTRASSTWATRRTASWCSSGRRSWASSREGAELSPINPYADDQERTTASRGPRPTSSARGTRCPTTRRRCSRAWPRSTRASCSHTDHELGRLLDYLEETGQLDNTIIVLVSDNGASGEGGPNGSVNENKFFNGVPDTIEENLALTRRARRHDAPTTTTPPAGRGRSTRRSRCGSATRTTRAARPTR